MGLNSPTNFELWGYVLHMKLTIHVVCVNMHEFWYQHAVCIHFAHA